MTEKNDNDKMSRNAGFKMDPPANAWNRLDAELERKQAIIYRQRANRFKMLSIGLSLLLFSFITYYYLTPLHLNIGKEDRNSITQHSTVPSIHSSLSHARSNSIATPPPAPIVSKNNEISSQHNELVSTNGVANKIKSASNHNVKGGLMAQADAATRRSLRNQSSVQQIVSSSTPSANNTAKVTTESKNVPSPETSESNSTKLNSDNSADERGPAISGETENHSNVAQINSSEKGAENKVEENNNEIKPTENAKNENAEVSPSAPLTPAPLPVQTAANTPATKLDSSVNSHFGFFSGRSRWSISLSYSPDYTRNHLTANNNNETGEYEKREKSLFSFGTGLAIRYNFTEKWSLSVGGVFSTMAYSINLPTIYAKTGSDNLVHYLYPTSCGVVVMPASTRHVIHDGDSLPNANCKQTVEFLSIPLLARYQQKYNHITFYVEGGASANFVLQEKATVKVASYKNEVTVLNNVDGLKKLNYGYVIGAGAEYRVFNGVGIFLEPQFKGSINSLTENIDVNCYPYTLGINGGVTLHF